MSPTAPLPTVKYSALPLSFCGTESHPGSISDELGGLKKTTVCYCGFFISFRKDQLREPVLFRPLSEDA